MAVQGVKLGRKLTFAARIVFNADYRFTQRFARPVAWFGAVGCFVMPLLERSIYNMPLPWHVAMSPCLMVIPILFFPRNKPFGLFQKVYWEWVMLYGVVGFTTYTSILTAHIAPLGLELAMAAIFHALLAKAYVFVLGFPVASLVTAQLLSEIHPEVSLSVVGYGRALFQSMYAGVVVALIRLSLEHYYLRLIDAERRMARLESEKQVAMLRLSSLRAKADPHFLFNTLNSICALHRCDPAKTEMALLSLSDLFRYILNAGDMDAVPLDQELSIVRAYLDLERLRFGDKLRYRIDVSGPIDRARLPALTIQPLVENAIKHGISPQGGKGTVIVEVSVTGSEAVIRVHDDGSGFAETLPVTGHGLSLVKDRLRVLYGERFSLELGAAPNGGAQVDIRFPTSVVVGS